MKPGKVYLVGAGPGDPGLLTLKAKRCLESADAVVFDRLLAPRLLNLAKPTAACYFAGKAPHHHTLSQDEINRLLVDLARSGKQVVRLKGGDPFVFGRGSEEAQALLEAGIEWEVVPGVTSAISAPAYAGIPVTHRGVSQGFTVVTGHECMEGNNVDWNHLASVPGTLLILMGVGNLGCITENLLRAGKPSNTPVALVRWGTRAAQETLVATLSTVEQETKRRGFSSPAVIVVGDVVRLRDTLSWVEKRPLAGTKTLVVAETRDSASNAAHQVEDLGGEVVDFVFENHQRPRMSTIDKTLDQLRAQAPGSKVMVFTSAIGVQYFFQRSLEKGCDLRCFAGVLFGSGSPEVSNALKRFGLVPDFQDLSDANDALADWLKERVSLGNRVWIEQPAVPAPVVLRLGVEELQGCTWVQWYGHVTDSARIKSLASVLSDEQVDRVWALSDIAWSGFAQSVPNTVLERYDRLRVSPNGAFRGRAHEWKSGT